MLYGAAFGVIVTAAVSPNLVHGFITITVRSLGRLLGSAARRHVCQRDGGEVRTADAASRACPYLAARPHLTRRAQRACRHRAR
jgi:hypothetical protein